MTLTLADAVAVFEKTLRYEDTDADEASDVDFDAIRAAVKDVALAVSWQRHDYMHSEVKAQINRLFEGSEGERRR